MYITQQFTLLIQKKTRREIAKTKTERIRTRFSELFLFSFEKLPPLVVHSKNHYSVLIFFILFVCCFVSGYVSEHWTVTNENRRNTNWLSTDSFLLLLFLFPLLLGPLFWNSLLGLFYTFCLFSSAAAGNNVYRWDRRFKVPSTRTKYPFSVSYVCQIVHWHFVCHK